MSLYVYAIVDRACDPPAEWRGLAGAHLSIIGYRSLAAVVSEIAAPPRRDTAALMRHEALVEALAARHRTLPVRFGTVLADAGAVEEALAERHGALAADLVRIGGHVELGIVALWREDVRVAEQPAEPASREGARYLQARRREYARASAGKAAGRQLASEIDVAVGDRAFDRRLAVVNKGRLVVRAAYLVAPADVAAIRDTIDELRGRRPDVAIVLSGPWPPYSFVSGQRGMEVEPIGEVPHAP